MKLVITLTLISFIIFSQCSLITVSYTHETFINPDIKGEIIKKDSLSDGQTPDIESVPKN